MFKIFGWVVSISHLSAVNMKTNNVHTKPMEVFLHLHYGTDLVATTSGNETGPLTSVNSPSSPSSTLGIVVLPWDT